MAELAARCSVLCLHSTDLQRTEEPPTPRPASPCPPQLCMDRPGWHAPATMAQLRSYPSAPTHPLPASPPLPRLPATHLIPSLHSLCPSAAPSSPPQAATKPIRHGYDHVLAEKVLRMEEKVRGGWGAGWSGQGVGWGAVLFDPMLAVKGAAHGDGESGVLVVVVDGLNGSRGPLPRPPLCQAISRLPVFAGLHSIHPSARPLCCLSRSPPTPPHPPP